MKRVDELTLKEFKQYANLRACDGRWGIGLALTCTCYLKDLPKRKLFERKKAYSRKCENHFKENIPLLFNLNDFPNMKIDIETGRIEVNS